MQKLLSIINEILEDTERQTRENLSPEMSLRNDIGFDSLDLARLTVMVEDEFNVDIFQDGVIDTVEEVITRINSK